MKPAVAFCLFAALAAAILGCQSSLRPSVKPAGLVDPLVRAGGDDLQRSTEVQLVEQMAQYRSSYQERLQLLKQYYDRQGNQLKASWAQEELENLQLGPQRSYLVVAEVAGPDLRASRAIVQADVLYQEGINSVKQGRGSLGRFLMNKKKLYLAIDKFNELITNYPDSDKIDDAAFQIAEVLRFYLNDYRTALLYYQRVWQWDPQTTLPARFWVARIYDEQFHHRIKALQYYELAISLEADYPANVVHAQNRIDQINRELTQE